MFTTHENVTGIAGLRLDRTRIAPNPSSATRLVEIVGVARRVVPTGSDGQLLCNVASINFKQLCDSRSSQ